MNFFIPFLAWRYIKGSSEENRISTMIMVCVIGIALGSFSLALVASIMNGFEKATHEKLQNIHAPVMMHSSYGSLDYKKIRTIIASEFPEITALAPSSDAQILVELSHENHTTSVALLKGIVPAQEALVTKLEKKIIHSADTCSTLSALLQKDGVLIGIRLAEQLSLVVNQKITIWYAPSYETHAHAIPLEQTQLTIRGIFKTGIEDFDSSFIFSSLDFFSDLFPENGVSQIHIRLADYAAEKSVITRLSRRFGVDVYSWKDLYPALISALTLEKYSMCFILALIVLVASMNIISLLFMYINQKKTDIAILKAMGLPDRSIRTIFLTIGIGISWFASGIGLLTAFLVGLIFQQYPFIRLPDAYGVTYLPVSMEFILFFLVFIVVTLTSSIATWFSVRAIHTVQVAHMLRHEG